ncbi:hypothetical protein [Cohnella nanjingensis]|uniref:Uncharacterized protein n=1 Tax=Cohnella nanjingensis TaxID=1387779 RepID=A0A7X0RX09_9BACL|nr:hypothetical protein [Cohnella nanjingensis]MBB6675155.1 hypothetical protein [Cohnella nanjingensis]
MTTNEDRDTYMAAFVDVLSEIRLLRKTGRPLGPRPLSAASRLQEETAKLMRALAELSGRTHELPSGLFRHIRRSPNSGEPAFFNESARIARVGREET